MADKIISKYTTGHVTFGTVYTVTSADAAGTSIAFNFNAPDYYLAAAITITNSATVCYATMDGKLTYPAEGYVKLENGSNYSLTSGDVISLVALRAN